MEDKIKKDLRSLIKRSLVYQERLAEREEILRHKWIESEKAGQDIGDDLATADWVIRYRGKWLEWRLKSRVKHQQNSDNAIS